MESQKIATGIVGCGRIARTSYLPALRELREVQVKFAVDQDLSLAQDTAEKAAIPHFTNRYEELMGQVDAVILLVPHHLHVGIAIDFLEHGVSVLCEKPLATSSYDCLRMIEAAQRGSATLGVALVRRQFTASRIVKMLIDQAWLGSIKGVNVEYGFVPAGLGARPPTCGWLYNKEQAGGGLLISDGIHILDLLLWWLSGNVVVKNYCDDGYSGVEAEAVLEMELESGGSTIPVKIELSLLRKLRNTLVLTTENGIVEIPVHRSSSVIIQPTDYERLGNHVLTLSSSDSKGGGEDPFLLQMREFTAQVIRGSKGFVSGHSYLDAMRVIDECYSYKKLILRPWEASNCFFPTDVCERQ